MTPPNKPNPYCKLGYGNLKNRTSQRRAKANIIALLLARK
jgi:hypothetical protein